MTESPLKAALIRGARAALFAFFGTLLPAVTKWTTDIYEWANVHGDPAAFPRPTGLAYAAVAGVAAAATGFIAFAVNYAENTWGFHLLGAKKSKLS